MSHVLIIDDDPTILQIVRATLEGAGHQGTAVESSSQALELLATEPFDAVILDLAMPPPDGLEVLQRLRAHSLSSSTPVLILSGRNNPGDGAKGIRAGADDYVVKPFEPSELVVRIERLIDRRRADATALVGRLEALQAADLLQNLCQGQKTGRLRVVDGAGEAEVYIEEGQILSAHHGSLRDVEAVLVLLEKETGAFRFESGHPPRQEASAQPLNLNGILMDAAWLEDEVTRRLTLLPSENQLLQVVAPRPPDPPELSCISLPFGEVYRQLSASPPMGYAQLLAEELAAPKKVALALTMLIEAEAVQAKSRPANSEAQQLPQALSPDAQVDLDQTPPREGLSTILGRFRHRAHQHQASPNSGQETLHLMVFYDPPVWERLLRIVETIPQSSLPVERARLINQLQMRRSGTLRLVGPEEGETLVYLQPLRGEKKGSSLFLSFASAAIAWLEEPESISKLTDLVESFAETRHPFGIIAPHLESRLFTSLVQSEVLHIVREEPLDVGDLLRALPLD